MSWLRMTQCNHCTLEKIKNDARRNKKKVVIKLDAHGWTEVTVDGVFAAAFMEVSDKCVC